MPKTNPKKPYKTDRFIPIRTEGVALDLQHAKLHNLFDKSDTSFYQDSLSYQLWGATYSEISTQPILNFTLPQSTQPINYKPAFTLEVTQILDAPLISSDYYHNPLCWNSTHMYVGLGRSLYSYEIMTKQAVQLEETNSPVIALAANPNLLLKSSDDHTLRYIDTHTLTDVRESKGSLYNKMVSDKERGFYALSRTDFSLDHHDERQPSANTLLDLQQTTLGLDYNSQTHSLALIGETVKLYDTRRLSNPTVEFKEHKSPAKAVAFFEGNNRIATGGGGNDRSLKIWNTSNGDLIAEANTNAQVCNIHWIGKNALFITEGFEGNKVSCWSIYNKKLALTTASEKQHDRVLFSAQNPKKGTEIVTGCAGETLSFWSVKNTKRLPARKKEESKSFLDMDFGKIR